MDPTIGWQLGVMLVMVGYGIAMFIGRSRK